MSLAEQLQRLIDLDKEREELETEIYEIITLAAIDYNMLKNADDYRTYTIYGRDGSVTNINMRSEIYGHVEYLHTNDGNFTVRIDTSFMGDVSGDVLTVSKEYVLRDPEERYQEIVKARIIAREESIKRRNEKEEQEARKNYELLKKRFEPETT